MSRQTQNDSKVIVGLLAELPDPATIPLGYFYLASDASQLFASAVVGGIRVWETIGGTAVPSGPAGGDLFGTYPNPNVRSSTLPAGGVFTVRINGVSKLTVSEAQGTNLHAKFMTDDFTYDNGVFTGDPAPSSVLNGVTLALVGGDGFPATGTDPASNAGSANLTGGNGGAASSAFAASVGGAVNLQGGTGGTDSTLLRAGAGGDINLVGGDGGAAVNGGGGGDGGNVFVDSGPGIGIGGNGGIFIGSNTIASSIELGQWGTSTVIIAGNVVTLDAATGNYASLAINSVDMLRTIDPSVSTNVGLLVLVNRAGVRTLSQVSVGATESGGGGFRLLRVPN